MEFKPSTIGGLFDSKISFTIPVYQRAYSWDKANWSIFLEDIIEQSCRENGYSYGNILLEVLEEDASYEIIDGQQRLTTLIIFMRALINVLEEKEYDSEVIADLKNDYIIRKGIIKLRPVDNDRACFDTVIVQDKEYKPNSPSQESIIKAKDFFIKELQKLDVETILKIREVISKTKINRLELKGKRESALMFELQNNRGRDLTNLERLKSYFMYQMYVNSTPEETKYNVETVSNNFKDIYKTIYDIEGLEEDSILIYHCNAYLDVAFAYKNLDNIKREFKAAEDKIEWIRNFTLELATSFSSLKQLQSNESKYLKRMKNMGRGSSMSWFVYPFILKGYKYFGNDDEKMENLFHIMEILSFRYHLIGSRAELDSRLSDAIRQFKGDVAKLKDDIKQKLNAEWYWSDSRVKEFLEGWMYENPMLRYILWQYEDSIQNKGYSIGSVSIENEQIEHISPRVPPEGEDLASGYDVDENNEYSQEFKDKKLNCIGNLMLISGSHNASIGNKPFEEKLESYKSNPLLKQQAEIPEFLTEGSTEWKTKQIDDRKKKILDFVIKQWDFDSIIFS